MWKDGKNHGKFKIIIYIDAVRDYYNAGGNGVAMRILPHVFYCYNDVDELMRQVVRNGMYTHGHPCALVGATVYAYALYLACRHTSTLGYGEIVDKILLDKHIWGRFPDVNNIGEWLENANEVPNRNYLDLWNETIDKTVEEIQIIKEGLSLGALDIGNEVLNKIGCFDKKINGAGDITAISAIYLASKYASNPKMGILEAANMYGADTDTLASMIGGLLGMIQGTEWIPLGWQGIQDKEYITSLVSKLTNKDNDSKKLFFNLTSVNIKLKDLVNNVVTGTVIHALPFGELKVINLWNNRTKTGNYIVMTFKLQPTDGQSLCQVVVGKFFSSNFIRIMFNVL
nr:ADP-ribosylglycohydrolase family protein [Thermoanaerobacterium thermosaccharolyticum]